MARHAQALINVAVASPSSISGCALTSKGGNAINAGAVVAGVWLAVIYILFTVGTSISFCALTGVSVGSIHAFGAIFAGRAGTFIDVVLTQVPVKTCGTFAVKLVDFIDASAIVEAGAAGTFIRIDLTEFPFITWHTDTHELPNLVQTRGIVLTGVGETLVNVDLAAGSRVAWEAVALERALGVDAFPTMFTGIGAKRTLIHIMVAGRPSVPGGAGADGFPVHWVGVTVGAFVAGVADTSIFQVTKQTCAAMGTLAVEGRYSIMAGGPAATSCIGTVINVFAAVLARPAVDTDTVVAAVGVVAGASILTGVWHQLTLINIFCAVLACPVRRTPAVVRVHTIHAGAAVLALVSRTVVNIFLTVLTRKSRQTRAIIGGVVGLAAGPTILARRRVARHVGDFTVVASKSALALAVKRSELVDAHPPILAGVLLALVNVQLAGFSVKSF